MHHPYPGDGEYSDPEHGPISPEAFAWGVNYLRARAAETADERWARYRKTDRLRVKDCDDQ